mgnify:CR=1 FL=1
MDDKNFVKLNDNKTEYLIICSPQMRNKIESNDVAVGQVSVSPSEDARNLGVYLDQSMNLDRHISHVCQTAYFQLRKLAAIWPLITRHAAESLIHSLITSRLDFCYSLLAGLPASSVNRLQAVQNAAARLLTGSKKYDHITPILTELHWLPVQYRVQFKFLLLTFKVIHNQAPDYMASLIEECHIRPGLRSSGLCLQVPCMRLKTYGDRAFSSVAPRLWNSLPSALRNIDGLENFKSGLKTYLFHQMCAQ